VVWHVPYTTWVSIFSLRYCQYEKYQGNNLYIYIYIILFFFFWGTTKAMAIALRNGKKKTPHKNRWLKPSYGRQKLDTKQQGGEGDPAPKEPKT